MKRILFFAFICLFINVPERLSAQLSDDLTAELAFGLGGPKADIKNFSDPTSGYLLPKMRVGYGYPLFQYFSLKAEVEVGPEKIVSISSYYNRSDFRIGVGFGTSTASLSTEYEILNRFFLFSDFKINKFSIESQLQFSKNYKYHRTQVLSPELYELFHVGFFSETDRLTGIILADYFCKNKIRMWAVFGISDKKFENWSLMCGFSFNMSGFQTED